MEYCEKGSLKKVIKSDRKIDMRTILDWGRQIADGLRYLHSKGLPHGDLRPES